MSHKELLAKDSFWMQEGELPIVLSTRVRLARNLEGSTFPQDMKDDEAGEIQEKITGALADFELESEKTAYLPLNELTAIEKKVLIEKHLISPEFAGLTPSRGVILSDTHRISVMVNEEDHIRIQVLLPGSNLWEAQRIAGMIDDYFEARLDIAYKEKFGYLTSCPTNVGTGLRVSVMVHLPALVMINQIQKVLGALTPLGLAVRGLYGEGSKAFGNIFQISNQITLGKSEEDTLTNMEAVTRQVVEHEMRAREVLQAQNPLVTADRAWRARGILQNARLLNSEETFSFLSDDRLGMDMGILPKVSAGFVSLLIDSLQGCLQYRANRSLEGHMADAERANFLRQVYASGSTVL